MGKKMKLPFLSHSKSLDPKLPSSPPWPWPACGNIKTLSFRASNAEPDDAFRTFNSAFLDTQITPSDSFFTISSSSRSISTMSEDCMDPIETVLRGLRSDRLFFEPDQTSSLVSKTFEGDESKCCYCASKGENDVAKDEVGGVDESVMFDECEMLSMDSHNPCEDFRASMAEMVDAHGLKDWHELERLLECFLKINGKTNHGYIMGAFIDLLVSLSFASSTSTSTTTITSTSSSSLSTNYINYSSPSSPLSLPSSSLTTPCLSSIMDHDDVNDDGNN